jgi:GNAT superfamily N-acetyltransferase
MTTEFRQAVLPGELRALMEFDAKVFPKPDRFPRSEWRRYESYWMLVNGRRVGCCALEKHVDFCEDGCNLPLEGCLYIATTGILPRFQRTGLGALLKAWQLAYARHYEFNRIVTNTRKRNTAMIALNLKYGFQIERSVRGYYIDPVDSTAVMSLCLTNR